MPCLELLCKLLRRCAVSVRPTPTISVSQYPDVLLLWLGGPELSPAGPAWEVEGWRRASAEWFGEMIMGDLATLVEESARVLNALGLPVRSDLADGLVEIAREHPEEKFKCCCYYGWLVSELQDGAKLSCLSTVCRRLDYEAPWYVSSLREIPEDEKEFMLDDGEYLSVVCRVDLNNKSNPSNHVEIYDGGVVSDSEDTNEPLTFKELVSMGLEEIPDVRYYLYSVARFLDGRFKFKEWNFYEAKSDDGFPPLCLARICRMLGYQAPWNLTSPSSIPGQKLKEIVDAAGTAMILYKVFPKHRCWHENHMDLVSGWQEPFTWTVRVWETDNPRLTQVVIGLLPVAQVLDPSFEYWTYDFFSPNDSADALDRYYEYLQVNYEGGPDRFFSPTGFLKKFEKTVELQVHKTREHIIAKSVDDAVSKLEVVRFGTEGVFDLTAEPGSGKTSVLPFRFEEKKVLVVEPTPFDAYNAFNMATGTAKLRLEGLTLGSSSARVVYTDSYMAASMMLSGRMNSDVVLVDECDCQRGVTPFLAEVRVPGVVLIRMSASHARTQSGPSRSFLVGEYSDMPDVRESKLAVVSYIKSRAKGRSLVLMPDAETAASVQELMPEATLLTSRVKIPDLARATLLQEGEVLYVSDDVCARGINLNLDAVFDSQLVAEHGRCRVITRAESYQRRYRVGRSRPGSYHCPGLEPVVGSATSDIDVMRANVVRAIASLPQEGDARIRVRQEEVDQLMCAAVEPYVLVQRTRGVVITPPVRCGSSSASSSPPYVSPDSSRSSSPDSIKPPSWVFYYGTVYGSNGIRESSGVCKTERGYATVRRRNSYGRDSGSISSSVVIRSHGLRPLPRVEGAPYATPHTQELVARDGRLDVPYTPPVMDLSQCTYAIDWPAIVIDRLRTGGDLPTLVPPASWRHTSVGGFECDWLRRLDNVALGDNKFDDVELEVVCRAWNKLVAMRWVRRTPGLSFESTLCKLEFCARYFQSYFLLSSVG